jgi:hypothetical protein
VQVAATCELAGMPAMAGPPIVPFTKLDTDVPPPGVTTTTLHLSSSKEVVLLFTIVKEQTPVVKEQETSFAYRYPVKATGGKGPLGPLSLTIVDVEGWMTLVVVELTLGLDGKAEIDSMPSPIAAITAMIPTRLIFPNSATLEFHLVRDILQGSLNCYVLGTLKTTLPPL